MSEPALLILEGIFHDPGEGLTVFPEDGDPLPLSAQLLPYVGERVQVALHHFPPSPPDPSLAGGGACLWGGFCPCGHAEDPGWLYNLSLRGVLEHPESGKWAVSGAPVPLDSIMLGHRGRLVLFRDPEVDPDRGVEDLLSEAEGLLSLLEGLRGTMKS